jgi:hypothetical protein
VIGYQVGYEDIDQRIVELNRRARLLREAARELAGIPTESAYTLSLALEDEAKTVATEAMALVYEFGAERGLCYQHGNPAAGEDPNQLYPRWARGDNEADR